MITFTCCCLSHPLVLRYCFPYLSFKRCCRNPHVNDVACLLQDPETAKLLRQISMDPSVIDSLLETPKIKFLADKIRAQYAKNPKYKVPQ